MTDGIAHGYIRQGIFSVEDVLSKLCNTREYFGGDIIPIISTRYHVFAQSLVCVSCGITGSYFAKEQTHLKNGKIKRWHLNLYALHPDTGDEVLMTQDHIIPRSKGGFDNLDNLQTMCSPCNCRKGNGDKTTKSIRDLSTEEGRVPQSAKVTRTSLRLFKREFVRVLFERLGWDTRPHTGFEERIGYDR